MYGLNDSWSQNSRGSGLERKEMIESEMHRFEINFFLKEGWQKMHEEYTAQKELLRETGEVRYRLKEITDMKSLNTAQRT